MQHPWDTQVATLPVGGVGVRLGDLLTVVFGSAFSRGCSPA